MNFYIILLLMIIVSNLFTPREALSQEVEKDMLEQRKKEDEKEEKPLGEQLTEEADKEVENTERLIKKADEGEKTTQPAEPQPSEAATQAAPVETPLEETPPEILADIMNRGIYLAGGGALIKGISNLFNQIIKIPVHTAEDPLTVVARGTGIILDNIDQYREILIADHNELPLR